MTGHCSKCHKIWTLETRQGLCPWCKQLATCQNQRTQALRTIKSRSNGSKRQAPSNGNGYDQLTGDWALYYKVTSYFIKRIRYEDRQDFLHNTMLEMAKVKAKYEVVGKPLTEAGLMRVADYEVKGYWRKYFTELNGVDCGHCSKAQRQKCRNDNSNANCPKRIEFISLDSEVDDGNGDILTLAEYIADDNAIDWDACLDAKSKLRDLPKRVIQAGYKRYAGIPLDRKLQSYLNDYRRRHLQKTLI